MLWEEVERFRELSGEDPEKTSIARIGGFLDGYEKGKACTQAYQDIRDGIKEEPTIEPRKKRKWIEQDAGGDGVFYECSVCKAAFTLMDGTPSDNNYNFCPNCGYQMGSED